MKQSKKVLATSLLPEVRDYPIIRGTFESHYNGKIVLQRNADGTYANISVDNDWRSYLRGWLNCDKALQEYK